MTTTEPTNGSAAALFNPNRSPLKFRPDQASRWEKFPTDKPLTFDEAAFLVEDARKRDGERTDVGAGALDKLALGYTSEGYLMLAKSEQVGSELRPTSAPLLVRKHAFSQLCERAKAPADYIARIPAKLAHACLQHGLATSAADKDGLIRMAGGEVRALVSSRYATFDDAQILDAVDAALTRHGLRDACRVRGVQVGTKMTLRITWPGEAVVAHLRGDVIERGIDVLNGEVGNGSAAIAPCTYVLACSNGMRRWSEGSRRLSHIGNQERLREAFIDALPVVLNEARGLVDAMQVATERLIDNLDLELSGLTQFGLSASETREVTRTVTQERGLALPQDVKSWGSVLTAAKDVTAYDVLNGLTAYAQTRPLDRRAEIEDAAGEYLAARTR